MQRIISGPHFMFIDLDLVDGRVGFLLGGEMKRNCDDTIKARSGPV